MRMADLRFKIVETTTTMNMRTEWNLKLLYQSGNDPKIEKDVRASEKAAAAFEKKYKKDPSYLKNENKLFLALTEYEKLISMAEGRKAADYFHYRKDLNSADQEAESKLNRLSQRLTKAANRIIFFELELGKIDVKFQKLFLKSKKLQHFRYYLSRVFKTAQYNLTESEEKIMNLKSLPSYSMWVQGQQKLLNIQTVSFKGKDIPLPQAYNMISELPTEERRTLSNDVNTILKNISYFAESELNAVYTNKKINDELYGFKEPYSSTIFHYQNDEKSIINFVETVTRHFTISHKFYKVKARMLGLDSLEYVDRAARVGKLSVRPSFDESLTILRSAFSKVDPAFTDILKFIYYSGAD
jgi:oligoendopeptidase F